MDRKERSYKNFCNNLIALLEERGFVNDRGWDKENENGMMFYSFVKNGFRFEIELFWNRKYPGTKEQLQIYFFDCRNEWYGGDYVQLHIGRKILYQFYKPFSKSMFNQICKHHGL